MLTFHQWTFGGGKKPSTFFSLVVLQTREPRTDLHKVRPINHRELWKQFLWSSGPYSEHHLACSLCLPARWATNLYTFHLGRKPVPMCPRPAWKLRERRSASSNWEYSIASEHRPWLKHSVCFPGKYFFWVKPMAKVWGWSYCHALS